MKTTSAPWSHDLNAELRFDPVNGNKYLDRTSFIRNAEGRTIAVIADNLVETNDVANMVAASPEMLEALEALIKAIDHPKANQFVDNSTLKVVQNIRTLIAKVRGES